MKSKQNKKFIISIIFFLNSFSNSHGEEHALSYLSEKEWEIIDFYQDNKNCKQFIRDLKNNFHEFKILKPVVEGDNWQNPSMQKHIAQCKKDDFIILEEKSKMSLGKGDYMWVSSGKKHHALERYAIWEFTEKDKKNIIMYVGPQYKIKTDEKGNKKKLFLNEGMFYELLSPSCNMLGAINGGRITNKNKDPVLRQSEIIIYKGSPHFLKISNYKKRDQVTQSLSLSKLLGMGKRKMFCNAFQK